MSKLIPLLRDDDDYGSTLIQQIATPMLEFQANHDEYLKVGNAACFSYIKGEVLDPLWDGLYSITDCRFVQ